MKTLLFAHIVLVGLIAGCKPKIYKGQSTTGEKGNNAPILMFDKGHAVYFSNSVFLGSYQGVLEHMRTYTSKTTYTLRKDSVFIHFDSIVERYSIIEGVAFGEPQRFVELQYDTAHKIYMEGKFTDGLVHLKIQEVRRGKDTLNTAATFSVCCDSLK